MAPASRGHPRGDSTKQLEVWLGLKKESRLGMWMREPSAEKQKPERKCELPRGGRGHEGGGKTEVGATEQPEREKPTSELSQVG